MVNTPSIPRSKQASLLFELLVAMMLLALAILPLSHSIAWEKRLVRAEYQRAVAMEIVDGEMEVLAAGEWRSFAPGTHIRPVSAAAATNLPPGQLRLTIQTNRVRLEWLPSVKHHGGPVTREITVP